MNKKLFALACLIQLTLLAGAQEAERPEIKPVRYYLGIQPGLKPILFNDYGQYAWDINLIPLTLKYAIDRHWELRMHSIWDIEVRPENFPTVLATVGIEFAVPYHFSLKNSEEGHRGFFVAPVITPAYNILNQYYMLALAGETGFAFLFGNRWSLNVSAQAGFQFQKYPGDGFTRIMRYAIPVIGVGIWL